MKNNIVKAIMIFVTFFLIVVLGKIVLNGFNFETDYLIDGLLMSSGFILGWYGYAYIHDKISNKNGKC